MELEIEFDYNDESASIKKWAETYNDPNEQLYTNSINQTSFTAGDIETLFQWKNQSPLSKKKNKSLTNKIISELATINALKKDFDKTEFNSKFKTVSAVWQIFLLHIISPNSYPIYDQNVHRALLFINGNDEWLTIDETISDKAKLTFYQEVYRPFCERLNMDYKEIDKGMFMLGQALKRIIKISKAYPNLMQIIK